MKISIPKSEQSSITPTNYFILVDNSGSIYSSVKALQDTVLAVHGSMSDRDTISIGRFSGRNSYEWFARGIGKNANIESLVRNKIYSSGLTHFNSPLKQLDDTVINDVKIMSGNDLNVFYFLSDGYSNDASPENETLQICRNLRSKFSSKTIVGYGSYYNRNLLLDMANAIGGSFNHVSSFQELKESGEVLTKTQKRVKIVDLPKCYEVIWQVTGDEILALECNNSKVEVLETDSSGELFALDYSELDSIPEQQLSDLKFVASLAFILSQKNKANLAVQILRKAGLFQKAKELQKAFTVIQKGKRENELKALALKGGEVVKEDAKQTQSINDFLANIKNNIGKVYLDMTSSLYSSISRKNEDVSKVVYKNTDKMAKIVGIQGNENRANINFLTSRSGMVTGVNDEELMNRIIEFNTRSSTPIQFPIETTTYKNYAFIANGDFNFDRITFVTDGTSETFDPEDCLDLFDTTDKEISIKQFATLYKTLIAEKAHASVLRYYISENSKQKHLVDLRVERYGEEGAKILNDMGFDYTMTFTPKSQYVKKDEDADYIPFLEIKAQLKGAATINAKDSYAKYLKKGKQNPGDIICWPLFEKYDAMKKADEENFVSYCQKTLEGVEDTVDYLSSKVSAVKFYLMITNSWFNDVAKSDEFEYDGLVVKVKEEKVYL